MGVGGGPTVADPTNVAFSFDMYNSKSNKGKATTNVILIKTCIPVGLRAILRITGGTE